MTVSKWRTSRVAADDQTSDRNEKIAATEERWLMCRCPFLLPLMILTLIAARASLSTNEMYEMQTQALWVAQYAADSQIWSASGSNATLK
jgi:hypothetical protein